MTETALYLDPEAPLDARVEDLLGRLSLAEKASQLSYISPAIGALGVPAYNWWNECLHGVARAGRATVFPQAINLASTWDREKVRAVADVIATEARAKHNEAVARGSRQQYQGLTFWTPNINIFRDPRWGRGQETWGEDPVLTAEMAVAMVRGLQGEEPEKKLKVAACAKHYAVHSGPEIDRHTFNAVVNEKDLWETYLPAFEALVANGVESVMGAYNRTNGEPCCGSPRLLGEILREKWGFAGHVVSDCWALKDFHLNHKVTDTPEGSAALALKNGCDLNCGCTYDSLLEAHRLGLVDEADIDRSLRRLLRCRFKLGLFDPTTEWDHLGKEVVHCPEHVKLAEEAATRSLVLLKNDREALPLHNDQGYLLLQGPHMTSVEVLLANYAGISTRLVTLLEGIAHHIEDGLRIEYRRAFEMLHPNLNPKNWAHFEARSADTLLLALGIDPNVEGEEGDAIQSDYVGDRRQIALPEVQLEFVRKVAAEAPETKKVAVVFSGSPMDLTELHDLVDAVLWAGYPGEGGGEALAQVLFGKAQPGGRLPFSFPKSQDDLPPYEDYAMVNRTYRYMENAPLYPFGFGLSYAAFRYDDLQIVPETDGFKLTVTVTNLSDQNGDEVVQVYLKDPPSAVQTPQQRLVEFTRIPIAAESAQTVTFDLPRERLQTVDENGEKVDPAGPIRVCVGGCCPIARSRELGAPAWLEAEIELPH